MQNPAQANERFSKRLTQSDVEKGTMLLPFSEVAGVVGFFKFQEDNHFGMDVVGSTGMAWKFLGSFHVDEEMGFFVSISLPQFPIEKALKANDEVVFTKQPLDNVGTPEKQYFKIEVRRKIRMFGQDIWGDLMV